jgi:acyl-CoA reductase-like NAD-dependent aldehyde dehydrogenase
LELGGKSAGVVFADADVEEVVSDVLVGAFTNSGQICSAESRLIVQETVYDDLVAGLTEAVGRLSVGPGVDDHDLTPLISREHLETVAGHCRRALDDGVKAACGGAPVDGLPGHFFPPTVFVGVDPAHPIAQEEIFGPVLTVTPFSDVDQAVDIANGTAFGLAAGVYTRDLDRAFYTAGRLTAGQVFINQWYAGGVETPFGGTKQSGFGREKGQEGLYNYVRTKNVAVRLAGRKPS